MSERKTSMFVKKGPFHLRQRRAVQMFGERLDRPQDEFPEYYLHARKLNYGLLDTTIRNISNEVKKKIIGINDLSAYY